MTNFPFKQWAQENEIAFKEDDVQGSKKRFNEEWGFLGGTLPRRVKRVFIGLRELIHEVRPKKRKPRKEIIKYLGDRGLDITPDMVDEWLKRSNG